MFFLRVLFLFFYFLFFMIFTELTDIKKFCSRFFLLIGFLFTGFSFLAMGNGLRSCPERVRRRSGEGGVGGSCRTFFSAFTNMSARFIGCVFCSLLRKKIHKDFFLEQSLLPRILNLKYQGAFPLSHILDYLIRCLRVVTNL